MMLTHIRSTWYTRTVCLCLLTMIITACQMMGGDKKAEKKQRQVRADTSDTLTLDANDFLVDGNFVVLPQPLVEPKEISNKAREGYRRALLLMKKNQYDNAEAYLKPLIIDFPDLSGPYVNLAIIRKDAFIKAEGSKAKKNENDKAKNLAKEKTSEFELSPSYLAENGTTPLLLNEAIAKNSLNFDAYLVLANTLRQTGQFAEAKDVLSSGLAKWAHHPELLENYGILHDLYLNDPLTAYKAYDLSRKIYLARQKQLSLEPDKKRLKQYKGWLVDLERRMPDGDQSALQSYKDSAQLSAQAPPANKEQAPPTQAEPSNEQPSTEGE